MARRTALSGFARCVRVAPAAGELWSGRLGARPPPPARSADHRGGVSLALQDLNSGAGSFDTRNVDVVVAPTLVHLSKVKSLLDTRYSIAAQNVWLQGPGAFTGEIPAEILADLGIHWTLTGHSERRALCGETNEVRRALHSPRPHSALCTGSIGRMTTRSVGPRLIMTCDAGGGTQS